MCVCVCARVCCAAEKAGSWHGDPDTAPLWWFLLPEGAQHYSVPRRVEKLLEALPDTDDEEDADEEEDDEGGGDDDDEDDKDGSDE